MEKYPSISRDPQYGGPYLVYDKLDGQNIRAEWSKKRGFYKFGSRKVLAGDGLLTVGDRELITIYEGDIERIFKKLRIDRAVCFFELFGPNSFAGMHKDFDPMEVALLDVYIHNRGMMDPRDFEKTFRGKVPMPSLLWRGNFNKEDAQAVRDRQVEGMTFEGVVVKGPPPRKDSLPVMFKVKSQEWLDKVASMYGDKAEELL
tara:strand:+ start:12745 stop:13350 length:606 start_codon:yes stop_codon:yes gene_type:complete